MSNTRLLAFIVGISFSSFGCVSNQESDYASESTYCESESDESAVILVKSKQNYSTMFLHHFKGRLKKVVDVVIGDEQLLIVTTEEGETALIFPEVLEREDAERKARQLHQALSTKIGTKIGIWYGRSVIIGDNCLMLFGAMDMGNPDGGIKFIDIDPDNP